jgi:hypothetical protein
LSHLQRQALLRVLRVLASGPEQVSAVLPPQELVPAAAPSLEAYCSQLSLPAPGPAAWSLEQARARAPGPAAWSLEQAPVWFQPPVSALGLIPVALALA